MDTENFFESEANKSPYLVDGCSNASVCFWSIFKGLGLKLITPSCLGLRIQDQP